MRPLTLKMEAAVQEYLINGGNKSAAYRHAYNTENMKEATINSKGYLLFEKDYVRARLEELREQLQKDNKVSLNMLVGELLSSLQFDPLDLYYESGEMRPLKEIAPNIRRNISEMGVKSVGSGELSREVTFAKTIDKHKTIDTLSKMFGFYAPVKSENEHTITGVGMGDLYKKVDK